MGDRAAISASGATVDYEQFLASKVLTAPNAGIDVDPAALHPSLFPFQRQLVQWSLRKGRAALFCDTGLGKTRMQLEWARLTGQRTLILAPLAVARQTVREGAAIGVEVRYARNQSEAGDGITITNYERLDAFNPDGFGAVVLDESSILKAMDGKTRTQLIETFRDTPYRLCCTATPAPNDLDELGNHAEFLGILTLPEMRATFFVNDTSKSARSGWRLRGHAKEAFFRWLASWGMSVKRPSDIGFDDDGYALPPLAIKPVILPTDYTPPGQLFSTALKGITDRAAVRKDTLSERCEAAAALVRAEPGESWLIWVGLNSEGDRMAELLPDAAHVKGNDDPETKAERLAAFADGAVNVLITKPSIAGFGLNFQRCARMAFVGLSDSYEAYYQSIRRCWRFGQTRSVDAYVVLTEPEEVIYHNVLRKERDAAEMSAELVKHVAQFERAELMQARHRVAYEPTVPMRLPRWIGAAA